MYIMNKCLIIYIYKERYTEICLCVLYIEICMYVF